MAGLRPDGLRALQSAVGNRGLARLMRMPRAADPTPPRGLEPEEEQAPPASGGGGGGEVPDYEAKAATESQPVGDEEDLAGRSLGRIAMPRALQRAERRSGSRWLMRYSGAAAASYAREWALYTNPYYPRQGNDCTNFVSQCMEAGGWKMVGGSCDDRKRDDVWWYGKWTCWQPTIRRSYTWAAAQNFANFLLSSGRGKNLDRISDLEVGDVLQMKFPGDENIHHTMLVTEKKDGNLFLSYHTDDHLHEPFWGKGGILERNPKASYYAWKIS